MARCDWLLKEAEEYAAAVSVLASRRRVV